MKNLSNYFSFNYIALSLAIGSFVPVTALPPAYRFQVESNEISIGARIEKLLDRIKNDYEQDNWEDLIENVLNLKSEAEVLIGRKIDLDSSIDQVFSDIEKQGVSADTQTQNEVKRIFKEKSNRFDHKVNYMAECCINDIEFDSLYEEILFLQGKYVMDTTQIENIKNYEDVMVVPLKVIVGIAGAIAGMIVTVIPLSIPGKTHLGIFLATAGIKYAADALVEGVGKTYRKSGS